MDNSKYIEAIDELIRYHQNSIATLEQIKSELVSDQKFINIHLDSTDLAKRSRTSLYSDIGLDLAVIGHRRQT